MAKLIARTAIVHTPAHKEVQRVSLTGIISTPTADRFRRIMAKAISSNRDILLDLKGVSYINSSGLSEIVRLHDNLETSNLCLMITNLDPEVKRLVVMLGLRSLLLVFPSNKQALASLDRGFITNKAFDPGQSTRFFMQVGKGFVPVKTPPPPKLPEAGLMLGLNPNDRFSRFLITCLSGKAGSAVNVLTGEEAKKVLSSGKIDIAIIDSSITEAESICDAIKTTPHNGLASVIFLHPEGFKQHLNGDVRVNPDEYAVEPFEIRELIVLAQAEYSRCQEESMLFKHEVSLDIASREQAIAHAGRRIEELLIESGLEAKPRDEFFYAIREAIDNARRHGNKEQEDSQIKLLYVLDKEKLTITVTDEGKGFDFEAVLQKARATTPVEQARTRHNNGQFGGLGVGLMVRCCDRVDYSPPGNSVRLTRYI